MIIGNAMAWLLSTFFFKQISLGMQMMLDIAMLLWPDCHPLITLPKQVQGPEAL